LEVHELLQTFAEVGIGLAGFSGIVVALRSRGGELPTDFLYMIAYSIGSVLFSLLPLLLLVSLPPAVSWRISASAMFVASLASLIPFWRPQSSLRPKMMPWWERGFAVLFIVAALALGCVALGFLPDHAAFVYSAVLLFVLGLSFSAFVTLLVGRPAAAQQSAAADSA